MFGIGLVELFIVLVVALIVVGPDKIPQVARWLGKTLRNISQFVHEIKTGIDLSGNNSEEKTDHNSPQIAPIISQNSKKNVVQNSEQSNPNEFPNPENLELNSSNDAVKSEFEQVLRNEPAKEVQNEPK